MSKAFEALFALMNCSSLHCSYGRLRKALKVHKPHFFGNNYTVIYELLSQGQPNAAAVIPNEWMVLEALKQWCNVSRELVCLLTFPTSSFDTSPFGRLIAKAIKRSHFQRTTQSTFHCSKTPLRGFATREDKSKKITFCAFQSSNCLRRQ